METETSLEFESNNQIKDHTILKILKKIKKYKKKLNIILDKIENLATHVENNLVHVNDKPKIPINLKGYKLNRYNDRIYPNRNNRINRNSAKNLDHPNRNSIINNEINRNLDYLNRNQNRKNWINRNLKKKIRITRIGNL